MTHVTAFRRVPAPIIGAANKFGPEFLRLKDSLVDRIANVEVRFRLARLRPFVMRGRGFVDRP